jgi:hypothetical protein
VELYGYGGAVTALLAVRAVLTVRAFVTLSCSVSPASMRCDPGVSPPRVEVTAGVVHIDF